MPAVDPNMFMTAMKKLILIEKDWIPYERGASLYIRPTMIATEPHIGVRPAKQYLFYIIVFPVGTYYPEGFNPIKIFVTEEFSRAIIGGTGDIKAGGNYAASLYASNLASEKGYTQVLWLDAIEKKYIEEVGNSNIFFVIDDQLITPPLTGTILPGVTRDSVIELCKSWNITVKERKISVDEFIAYCENNSLKECFVTGTAAIISPVGNVFYREREYLINNGKTGELTQKLYDELLKIQYGHKHDEFGWSIKIG
jgi:branched-chain amino acid aminotransferase